MLKGRNIFFTAKLLTHSTFLLALLFLLCHRKCEAISKWNNKQKLHKSTNKVNAHLTFFYVFI